MIVLLVYIVGWLVAMPVLYVLLFADDDEADGADLPTRLFGGLACLFGGGFWPLLLLAAGVAAAGAASHRAVRRRLLSRSDP